MNKQYQKIRKQAYLAGALCAGLVTMPATAVPLLSQTNPNPSIFREAPYNRGASTPLNPNPGIFQEAPYNRSVSPYQNSAPSMTPPMPSPQPARGAVSQPPLPEQRQAPIARIIPNDGKVSIKLINETGADISYQVVGHTQPRSLLGKSNVMLQDLPIPTTVTFRRQDGGLLTVIPQTFSQAGMLEVRLGATTDLGADRNTMRIQTTGSVFLN